MRVQRLDDHVGLIDVETAGIKGFVASYVLKGKDVILVETGPTSSIPDLLEGLEELDVGFGDVAYVAITHVHLDHGGGAGTLLKHLPNARLIVHQRGAPHMINPEKLWQQSQEVLGGITRLYGAPEPVPEGRVIAAGDGMVFDVGEGVKLRTVETLGHASHHLSFHETLGSGLFPGDAAGIYLSELGLIVPTTPTPFRLDIALASLEKLANLNSASLNYSHFGRATNVHEMLHAYAEQLRLWARIAKEGLDRKESLMEISQRIRMEDPAIGRAIEYIEAHAVLGETVLNESVQGVVSYVERFGMMGL